jgi:hypothetical protein
VEAEGLHGDALRGHFGHFSNLKKFPHAWKRDHDEVWTMEDWLAARRRGPLLSGWRISNWLHGDDKIGEVSTNTVPFLGRRHHGLQSADQAKDDGRSAVGRFFLAAVEEGPMGASAVAPVPELGVGQVAPAGVS